MKRIFVAIEISDDMKDAALTHAEKLRHAFPDLRISWEKREKLHITLRFLGEIREKSIESVNKTLGKVAREFQPFELVIDSLGVFPNKRRPRILWLGSKKEIPVLTNVKSRLDSELEKAGFEADTRRYHPHVTIARLRVPSKSKGIAKMHVESEYEPAGITVSELVLVESRLGPGGSTYHILDRHPLQ